MAENQVYIRIKRRNQTFCLLCFDSDKVLSVKEQVARAVQQHSEKNDYAAASLRLLLPDGTVLQDDVAITEYGVKEDTVLHVVFPVADNEWESVDIVSTEMQE